MDSNATPPQSTLNFFFLTDSFKALLFLFERIGL